MDWNVFMDWTKFQSIIEKYQTRCINSPISCSFRSYSSATRLLIHRQSFTEYWLGWQTAILILSYHIWYWYFYYTLALVSLFTVFFLFHVTKRTLPMYHVTIFKTSFRELPCHVAKMKIRKEKSLKNENMTHCSNKLSKVVFRKMCKLVIDHWQLLCGN